MRREILRGRYRHYLTPEERRISPAAHALPLKHLRIIAGMYEKASETSPEKHSLSNDEDEAWIRHMLALAADTGQDEQKKEKTQEQSDSDLINDFIHHRGEFAL